jgi:NADH-quinone oxidoreductase subunit G
MRRAQYVISLSAYKTGLDYAHVLLPIAPFTETSGSFVSTEGRLQSFHATVNPLGEARPAWKVLRVLGNLLGVPGFDYDSTESVRREALGSGDIGTRLDNRLNNAAAGPIEAPAGDIERIGEVPIYQADAIVRRAVALQKTRDAAQPVAAMNGDLFGKLGLRDGDNVRILQGSGSAVVAALRDDRVPANCIRLPGAHPITAGLGGMFGPITAERVAAAEKVAV